MRPIRTFVRDPPNANKAQEPVLCQHLVEEARHGAPGQHPGVLTRVQHEGLPPWRACRVEGHIDAACLVDAEDGRNRHGRLRHEQAYSIPLAASSFAECPCQLVGQFFELGIGQGGALAENGLRLRTPVRLRCHELVEKLRHFSRSSARLKACSVWSSSSALGGTSRMKVRYPCKTYARSTTATRS